ncbi:MAG: rod shape-determining protein MreD [Coriobacteriia bacterium]
MSKVLPSAIVLLAAFLLQVAIAPQMAIGSAVPNMILLAVVSVALTNGAAAGATAGFMGGLAFDLIGLAPVGPAALVMAVVGYIAGSLHTNMFAEGWRLPVTVVALASLFAEFSYAVVLAVVGAGAPLGSAFVSIMLPTAVYNVVLVMLVFPLMARFLRREQQMTTFRRLA